jgi:hypothetical protein
MRVPPYAIPPRFTGADVTRLAFATSAGQVATARRPGVATRGPFVRRPPLGDGSDAH